MIDVNLIIFISFYDDYIVIIHQLLEYLEKYPIIYYYYPLYKFIIRMLLKRNRNFD